MTASFHQNNVSNRSIRKWLIIATRVQMSLFWLKQKTFGVVNRIKSTITTEPKLKLGCIHYSRSCELCLGVSSLYSYCKQKD